jgi:hypothetical protein
MSFRDMQSWPRRTLFAGALAAMPLTCGLMMPRPGGAQHAYDYGYGYPGPAYSYSPQAYPGYPSCPSYGRQYYGDGDWVSGRNGQGRPWSEKGWRRGDRSTPGQDRGPRRTDEGRSGSSGGHSSGGRGQGGSGSSVGGNSGAASGWLGSHGGYR